MALDRAALRARRRALPADQRAAAAAAVAAAAVSSLLGLGPATRVGAYHAVQGELDPAPLAAHARAQGALVYLPAVRGDELRFGLAPAGGVLAPGRFGVPEPAADAPACPAEQLDIVFLPVVAFDRTGTRAGTGAGFYDRAFAFRRGQPAPPRLVGLAYWWQEVPALERAWWDVPLDLVVTDRGVIVPNMR